MHTVDTNYFIRASTQYAGVPFTGYANFNGAKLAVSSTGLFQVCCGNKDNGEDIDAYFGVIKTNFGSRAPKRLRFVHVEFESDADLLLEVSVDDQPAKQYKVEAHTEGQQRTRVTISRDQKGAFWYFRLKNYLGNDFAIDGLSADVIILSEGYR